VNREKEKEGKSPDRTKKGHRERKEYELEGVEIGK
jgi:hypothetical protein